MVSTLITGSLGLIGSEVCTYFALRGFTIHGVDNNERALFLVVREKRDGIKED